MRNHSKPTTRILLAGAMLLAGFFTTTARADYSSTVSGFNPLGYWQFNETAASPYALFKLANSGLLGSVADAYANPLVTNGVAGMVNNAIRLPNGGTTGHIGPKVDVVYVPGLNTTSFSIEFWAKPDAGLGNADATGLCPISNFNPNGSGGARVGWLFYVAPTGRWNFRLGLTAGYSVNIIATTGTASPGVWQHIVATYDGTNCKLYANGVQIGSATSSAAATGWVPNTGSFLRFGGTPLPGDTAATTSDGNYYLPWDQGNPPSGNRGWDGYLDEIACYTNALSASTVAAHYAAASTPATYGSTILLDNPVGYWQFDEAAVARPPSGTVFPVVANSGTLGSVADATNLWGVLAAQSGPDGSGFGAGNKAALFDGMSGFCQVKDAPGLHFTGNITLMAWVKPTAGNYKHNIINHGFDGLGQETGLRLSRGYGYGSFGSPNYAGYYEMGASEGAQNDGWYDSALAPIPIGDIGKWVFLAGTYDGSNWNLYRNGILMASAPRYVGASVDNGAVDVAGPWTIGSRQSPSWEDGGYFGGGIDEVAVFNTALSAANIAAIYNAAHVPPVITRAPQNPGTVFKGDTVSFSVWANGEPTLGYMWISNGVPTGVTTTNYTISNIPVGTFTVQVDVTNANGTASPSVTFSSIAAPPTISKQPVSTWRFAGLPFSFSVTAGGSLPRTYYWSNVTSGVLVQAGPSSTYSNLASDPPGDYTYSCLVSNEAGALWSSPAVLKVVATPSGYGGQVLGSGPIAYWRLGESSGTIAHDGVNAYDGTYNGATLGVAGYSVIDSDTAAGFSGDNSYVGGISGTAINFTGHTNFTLEAWVNAPPGAVDQSTIIAKGLGDSGTTRTEQFALDVSGGVYRFFTTGGATVYEADATVGPNGTWQHVVGVYDDLNTLGGGGQMYIYVNGELQGQRAVRPAGLNGTTSAVSIGSKRLGNDPAYNGTFPGTVDEVAVYAFAMPLSTAQAHYAAAYGPSMPPFVAVQPASVTNYAGLSASISVGAGGTVPLTYQWKKNGVDLSDGPTVSGSFIVGSTSQKLTVSSLTSADEGNYTVGITNGINPGTISAPAYLKVLAAPTGPVSIPGLVMRLPFNNNLNDATGRGNNGTGVHVATNMSGSPAFTTNTQVPNVAGKFEYTAGKLGSALHYSTVAVNTGGSSSIGIDDYFVTLGVRPDLQFGTNVDFSVSMWVQLPLNWIGGDLPFFTDVPGSLGGQGFVLAPAYGNGTASANANPLNGGAWAYSLYDGGNVGARVYGEIGSLNDGNWHHLVYVFSRKGGSGAVYLDGSPAKSFKISGTYAGAAYNIDASPARPASIGQDPGGLYGETGEAWIDDLSVWTRALTPLEAASVYVSGNAGFSPAYVPPPVIVTQPISITAAAGTATNLSVVASTSTGVTNYQWFRNGVSVPGATSATLNFASLAYTNYGDYQVRVDDGGLIIYSTTVAVRPPASGLIINTPPSSKAAPYGVPTSLTVVASTASGGTNYQWQFDGTNVTGANYSGATTKTLTIGSMRATNVGPYTVVVNDGYNYTTSTPAAVLTLAVQPTITNSRVGSTLNMTFATEVGPQYVVEWKGALTNGAWNKLVTNNGTGSPITVPDSTSGGAQRFYRVRMQ